MAFVSIIIRTCNRPEVLRSALKSVKEQTYKDIEVIIIEDGPNTAEKMVAREFSDLNIQYKATGKKCGRVAAGNLGLGMAHGEYINFLDDDDLLYPNHLEILLDAIRKNGAMAAYGIAEESQIVKISDAPYKTKEKRRLIRYKQPYNRLLLYSFNYLPIQSVLFHRKFYENCGGFDETLEMLEDWDLWVRYSTMGEFLFVPQVTSLYHVPYRGKQKKRRSKDLDHALAPLHEKFKTYRLEMNVCELHSDMDYVLNVYNQKTFLYYLKMVWNYFVYGER